MDELQAMLHTTISSLLDEKLQPVVNELGFLRDQVAATNNELGFLRDQVTATNNELGFLRDQVTATANKLGLVHDQVASTSVDVTEIKMGLSVIQARQKILDLRLAREKSRIDVVEAQMELS